MVSLGPSAHLTWDELACKDGTRYPVDFILDGRVRLLAETFEIIRDALGGVPIRILSAYRHTAYNKRIGGAKHSQHIQGRALDIVHPTLTPDELYTAIKRLYKDKRLPYLGGLGSYPRFTHFDVRTAPSLVQWFGGRKDADQPSSA